MIVLALLLQAAAPPAATPEIVVTARRQKCDVSVAEHILSDREFSQRATEWAAGEPLRVVAARRTGYKCLARIALRLNDHGVKRFIFVDPQ